VNEQGTLAHPFPLTLVPCLVQPHALKTMAEKGKITVSCAFSPSSFIRKPKVKQNVHASTSEIKTEKSLLQGVFTLA
jgi:hypothetical protein